MKHDALFLCFSLAEKLKQQKSRLNRTRTLVRREDGSTEVEVNGIRITEPYNVASTHSWKSVMKSNTFSVEMMTSLQAQDSFPGFVVDTVPDLQLAEVIPGSIFLGSQDVAADIQLLRSRGITHVLNAARSAVDNFYPGEFEYRSLDLLDAPEAELPIDEIVAFLSKEKEGARILVHCNAGLSRYGYGTHYDTSGTI